MGSCARTSRHSSHEAVVSSLLGVDPCVECRGTRISSKPGQQIQPFQTTAVIKAKATTKAKTECAGKSTTNISIKTCICPRLCPCSNKAFLILGHFRDPSPLLGPAITATYQ